MAAQFVLLGLGILLLPALFRLALRLRLGVPMLYAVAVHTVFRGWYLAHAPLADNIFLALLGLVILSWAAALLRKVWDLIAQYREDRAAMELLRRRIRAAREKGESSVSTDGLYR